MIALSLRLLRLGGRRAWSAAGLVGAGVAVATTLLAIALGALHGLDAREDRTAWRTPAAAAAGTEPIALLRARTDHVAGRTISQIDLVDPDPAAAPPPGLPRMPLVGELWVSPALAELLRTLPVDQLADRYPARGPTGVIGDAALIRPDELVAVVGRPAGDPVLTAAGSSQVVPVAGFDRPSTGADTAEVYRQLTYIAVVLMVFPVASLLGASARLTAARRVERLATLRLLGASTRQITVAAVTEVTAVATAAAVVGVAAQWLLAPALAHISIAGGGWFAADLRPSPLVSLGIVAGVALMATGAAIDGLRQVVVSPLGVARRQRPQGARLVRWLGLVGGVVVFGIANRASQDASSAVAGPVFGIGILALFGALSLIGPLIVRLLGRSMAGRARSVPALLAGRRLLDDPKGAFRPLAGLTLAVFVAGFLAPLTTAIAGQVGVDDGVLQVRAPAAQAESVAAAASDRLRALGIPARVGPVTELGSDTAELPVLPAHAGDRDRARTALAALVPGSFVYTAAEADTEGTVLFEDLGRGTLVVLVATFLVAATATGTAAAARVLDQRRALRLLRLAGTPLRVLDKARRAETVLPLCVLVGVALALGLLCASPFTSAVNVFSPSGLAVLGGVLAAGVALVVAASAASRPLLRSVTTGPGRED
ncbi:FtsX-like permease family protein [Pseudonocardia sp. H11422]|uniref:FtsX-like permease family protein n=1 Tax=Pseudonocardia sp. H11422 TaxID=2835866 RepID=UPI001BDDA11F|nr:FtsX-like permease family protein [Pseudonocardia sp. H11422]